MRVSLEPTDKGYVPNATHIDAYVDNQLISDCITVDEEQGYVIARIRNPNGSYKVIKGIIQLHKLKGKVMLAGMPYKRQTQLHYQDLPSNRS